MTKKKFDNFLIVLISIGAIIVCVASFFAYNLYQDITAKEITEENNITLTKNNFAVLDYKFLNEQSYLRDKCFEEGDDGYDLFIIDLKLLNLPEDEELFRDFFVKFYVNGEYSDNLNHGLSRSSNTGSISADIQLNVHEENKVALCFQIKESDYGSSNEVCIDSFTVEPLC